MNHKICSYNKTKLLLFIYLVTVIPTFVIYLEHAIVEMQAHLDAKSSSKAIKTMGEALLFFGIGIGYILLTVLIFVYPNSRIPYLVILVGTVVVVILYYMRIYGIPIPGTLIVITDFSSDWRDVITKICQQILVIPIAILLGKKF